jgi:hypothetical protein
MANYSFKTGVDLPEVPENKTFTESNFYQLEPETEIFAGVTGLIFIRCNLINCKIPVGAFKASCYHAQYNFCTNLRPDLINRGLTACVTECSHMTSKEEIWIDSVLVDTVYKYVDTKVIP